VLLHSAQNCRRWPFRELHNSRRLKGSTEFSFKCFFNEALFGKIYRLILAVLTEKVSYNMAHKRKILILMVIIIIIIILYLSGSRLNENSTHSIKEKLAVSLSCVDY
jgi:hypothetical protein